MTLWRIFSTEAGAQAYTEAEAAELLPLKPEDVTRRLADPIQLVDGRWIVQCFDGDGDGDGEAWQPDWEVPPPLTY